MMVMDTEATALTGLLAAPAHADAVWWDAATDTPRAGSLCDALEGCAAARARLTSLRCNHFTLELGGCQWWGLVSQPVASAEATEPQDPLLRIAGRVGSVGRAHLFRDKASRDAMWEYLACAQEA
jgi:hypothetical protein